MESHAMYKVRLADKQEFGPASLDDIVEWARQRRVPMDALLVNTEDAEVRSVLTEPRLRAILQAPPTSPMGPLANPNPTGGAGAASLLIPANNPCALTGYYMAVFSIVLPILAPVAIILGIFGIRARMRRPEVHGIAHAWVAIVGGFLVTSLYTGLVLLAIYA